MENYRKLCSTSAVSNDTAEFFAHANISVKTKPYAKILKHMNLGPNELESGENDSKNLVTLSL